MATRLGMDAKLYRNSGTGGSPTWVEVTNVKDLSLNLQKATTDVSTRSNNGWRAKKGTLKEGTVTFQMVWDDADANLTAISSAFFNNTEVQFLVLDGPRTTAPYQGLRAFMDITNFTRNENMEEAIMFDVTLEPTANVTYPASWVPSVGV